MPHTAVHNESEQCSVNDGRKNLTSLLNEISSSPPTSRKSCPINCSNVTSAWTNLLHGAHRKFFFGFILFVAVQIWYYYLLPSSKPRLIAKFPDKIKNTSASDESQSQGQVHLEAWCKDVPRLEPFHETIKHLVRIPPKPLCTSITPLLFNSTRNTIYPVKTVEEFKNMSIFDCCYKDIKREYGDYDRPDNRYGFSPNCTPISLDGVTKILPDHEFAAIFCRYKAIKRRKRFRKRNSSDVTKSELQFFVENYTSSNLNLIDMIPFVNLKPKVEDRVKAINKYFGEKSDRYNVILLGLDSVSHMNFIRTFANSHKFLVEELSAIQMNWYNKIDDNTYPNVIPFFTGKSAAKINAGCADRKYFDTCPIIWNDFSKKGYRTAFIEDAPDIGVFNYLKYGFKNVPTDYYLRPYSLAADNNFGKYRRIFVKMCHGRRLIFQTLMEYLKNFVETMDSEDERRLYFYTMWSTTLTHDGMNDGFYGDPHLLRTLQWLHEGGHLNNTILIMLSDHGRRFGNIRSHLQGQLEDRLPLMYFVMPQSFRETYPRAFKNLKGNSDSLVTTYDLYQTVRDISNYEEIEDDSIKIRESQMNATSPPLGMSLFLPVPPSRTCKQAGVPFNYCACNKMKNANIHKKAVKSAAYAVVDKINRLTKRHRNICEVLELSRVLSARMVGPQFRKWEAYQISLEAIPGHAIYEALVTKEGLRTSEWQVSGTVDRTDIYGNQSACVNEVGLKYYCYCKAFRTDINPRKKKPNKEKTFSRGKY